MPSEVCARHMHQTALGCETTNMSFAWRLACVMKAQSRTSRSFAAVDRWRFTYTGAEQQLVAVNIVSLHDSMLQS